MSIDDDRYKFRVAHIIWIFLKNIMYIQIYSNEGTSFFRNPVIFQVWVSYLRRMPPQINTMTHQTQAMTLYVFNSFLWCSIQISSVYFFALITKILFFSQPFSNSKSQLHREEENAQTKNIVLQAVEVCQWSYPKSNLVLSFMNFGNYSLSCPPGASRQDTCGWTCTNEGRHNQITSDGLV